MKQYIQPELRIYEITNDLLTVRDSAEQGNGVSNITFDWENPNIFS